MKTLIEWTKMPRGTYRYSENGLTADVWQVAGKGWLWAVYEGETPVHGHEGIYQPSLDAACELSLQKMGV
jgi:hypothetical protein